MAHSLGISPQGGTRPRTSDTALFTAAVPFVFVVGFLFGLVLLLLFFVLSSYLRELWVWFCSFSFGLKGFIIPGSKHSFGHFGRDQEMQPLKSPDSKYIKQSETVSPPWSLMLVEEPTAASWGAQPGPLWHAERRPCPGPPCQERVANTQRVGTSRLTKTEAGVSMGQVLLRDFNRRSQY